MTIREKLAESETFGEYYDSVAIFDGKRMAALYATPEEMKRLRDGYYFDGAREIASCYRIGRALVAFAEQPLPTPQVDALMSNRKKKWKSYTVEAAGYVSAVLRDGTEIRARNFDELRKRI